MKSRFQFAYVCKTIKFTRTHETRGILHLEFHPKVPNAPPPPPPQQLDLHVAVEPASDEAEGRFPDGHVFVTLPGSPEDTHTTAYRVAHDLGELINFVYGGGFQLQAGLVTAERIPETPEEAETIGEGRYWATVRLQQVGSPVEFDGATLKLLSAAMAANRVVAQFNAAVRQKNPIDQYLGFFRVVENFYVRRRKGEKARSALRRNSEFRGLLSQTGFRAESDDRGPLREAEVDDLIHVLVGCRDRCAHLREEEEFGYTPADPEVGEEIRPLVPLIHFLAGAAIDRKLKALDADAYQDAFSKPVRKSEWGSLAPRDVGGTEEEGSVE